VVFLKSSDKWAAAPLVPWLVWAMLAYALANVLVSNLIARSRWDVVPWVVLVAVAYVVAFRSLVPWLLQQSPTGAYQAVALLVGGANALLLVIAILLTRYSPRQPRPNPG
jgi:uncharacterized membrane protein